MPHDSATRAAPPHTDPWSYPALRALVADRPLPLMLVDLDVLEANTARLAGIAGAAGKTLRVASKSVRVPGLLRRILDHGEACRGLMCFAAEEAAFLFAQGFDDLLIAYPCVQKHELRVLFELVRSGAKVVAMLDLPAHVEHLAGLWKALAGASSEAPRLPVAIDVDVSYRPFGRRGPHLGVQRSSIRDLDAFREVLRRVRECPQLRLAGVMAYEAQIAGIGERSPFTPLLNLGVRGMKALSRKDVARRRQALAAILEQEGCAGLLFNGGGTGSLTSSAAEPWLTEVTAGSGFLQSHLFDYYTGNENRPAFCFALPVTRQPQAGIATCQSGGFNASGACGPDRAPRCFRPEGLRPVPDEGFGEVQTPLQLPRGLELPLGAPVFFRPAKAGEIAEHFPRYLLKRGAEVVDEVETYRGFGKRFF